METVIVVDTMDKKYHSRHSFLTLAEAMAFCEGMEEAWKISHGQYNCWRPFALGNERHRAEWEVMGAPGKDRFI